MPIFRDLVNYLFPRYCAMCGEELYASERGFLCVRCNLQLPRSYLWHQPFDNALARRFWCRQPMEKAVAYLKYNPQSSTALLFYDFKYHNRPRLAEMLGRMMAMEMQGSDMFNDIDRLVPVPLNPRRERLRGYNQSSRLAHGISDVTGIPVVENAVERYRHTQSQTRFNAEQRQENVSDIFRLTSAADMLSNCHCLIIDDVITTGSTVSEVARTLLNIKGCRVSVLALGYIKNIR